jgi:transcriptional regulator with XRE-family HTH domain
MSPEYKHSCINVNKPNCLTVYNPGCSLTLMRYGERLRIARQHAKLTQPGLAAKMKNVVTQQNISLLENGNATGSEFTVQFAKACGVRAEWLAMEEGGMLDQPYEVPANSPEKTVLLLMERMDEATKYKLIKISDTLAEPQGNGGDKPKSPPKEANG